MNKLAKRNTYTTLVNDIAEFYNRARKMLVESYWQIGRRIVEHEQQGNGIESKQRSRLCIGSDAFHEHIEKVYQKLVDSCDCKEDASFRHAAHTYPMNAVLDCVCKVMGIDRSVLMTRQRDSLIRPIAARALRDHAGMAQREVADVFNLSSGRAVSKQSARLSEMINKDKTLQKNLADIDRTVRNCC
jgi:hypothetical protein